MAPKFSAQKRLEILEGVLKFGEPVNQVCRKYGISRTLFYRWKARFEKASKAEKLTALKPKPPKPEKLHPRKTPRHLVKEILAIVQKNPKYSSQKISERLPKNEYGKRAVGNHGVQNILKRHNLNTYKKRLAFAKKPQRLPPEVLIEPIKKVPGKLTPSDRLEIIEKVVEERAEVADVCQKFGISRTIFYRLKERYDKASEGRKLEALTDKKPVIERYWHQAPEKYEETVFKVVIQHPEFSSHKIVDFLPKIAGKPILGNHGVQNVLRRHNLNTYEKRLAYSQAQIRIAPRFVDRTILAIQEILTTILGIPAPARQTLVRNFGLAIFLAFFLVAIFGFRAYLLYLFAAPYANRFGLILASFSLSTGSFFFLYSLKYYITLALVLSFSRKAGEIGEPTPKVAPSPKGIFSRIFELSSNNGLIKNLNQRLNNNKKGIIGRIFNNGFLNAKNAEKNAKDAKIIPAAVGLEPSLEGIKLKRKPFVSVHLPFYNEKEVADRILASCAAFDYPPSTSSGQANFEVIVCDDSTDETTEICEDWAKKDKRIKVIHRATREGFKGGALREALRASDPRTEFVIIFDADFVPYPDTIEQFLKYFKAQNKGSEDYQKSNVAAVQGYQWHVLNKSENWVTRGIRTEYAGSYVIERSGAELYRGLKMIAGSVYMIRADVLKKFGWGTSITEDFELTLKIYEKGYKVVYTPYIQAPAECVSTLKRLIRQRMRWAEGHGNNVKKMFLRILKSPYMTLPEKLEFLYLSPYYLQAAFFLVGTFCWLLAEAVFRARLPFWTSLWGWSLVLTNFFSLPLMNAAGLFLEESENRDYLGLLSFIALSYLLVPFQAYASVKGFLEREEGPWFRTPKTGKITDIFTRGRFYRLLTGIFPWRPAPAVVSASISSLIRAASNAAGPFDWAANPYLALATANNRFENFAIRPRHIRWIGNLVFSLFIFLTSALIVFAPLLPLATVSANETGRVITGNGREVFQEKINSQVMVSWEGGEAIFHKELRVRYKMENNAEVEITTLEAKGLGKARQTLSYQEGPLFVYPEIFENADLIYRVWESKVNESLLLKKYQPIEYLEQRLRLIDLVAAKDDKGQIVFASKNGGAEILVIQKPFMYEEKNPEARSEALVYELEKKGSDYILRKVLTEEGKRWLAQPDRQFPVVIDPTIYTSNVSTGIAVAEAQFGSNQRKITYSSTANGGAAWYVVFADGNQILYKRCLASSLCDEDIDWSAAQDIDDDATASHNNPTLYHQSDSQLWVAWIDNAGVNPDDTLHFRYIDTTTAFPHTLGTHCETIDQTSLDTTNYAYIAAGTNGDVVVGYSDTAGDAEADIFEVPTGTCTFTSIETGSGLPTGTTTMRPVALGLGNKIHIVYDDAANEIRHSIRDVSTDSWDSFDTVADAGNVVDDIFSVTTDGSSLWLLYRDAATTTVLQKCASPCTTTWTNLTAPWTTGLTSADYPNIGYMSTENDLKACINNGSTTTSQDVVCKSTDATTISWGDEFPIGFTASDFAQLSLVMSAGNADQMALVVHDVTNTTLKFATVPENLLLLLFLAPFLPKALKKIRERRRKL